MKSCWILGVLVFAPHAFADGAGDNLPDKVRPVPPAGIAIPEEEKRQLTEGVQDLGKLLDQLRRELRNKAALLDLLPDVQIYFNAVHYPLTYNEFYSPKEFQTARTLLRQGWERALALQKGQAPWTTQTGLVVRGYVSRIDGSVQPYGLVVPSSYRLPTPHRFRLDVWFHGRSEKLTELNFLNERQTSPGPFTPANTFVLHPYGRYCNANKLAGEVDTFEALAHVRKHYPIDENRLTVRGFSMGGAACWQFAVHYAGLWAAAAPGAGFAETADFLKVFQKENPRPTWYEQKLWHLYDSTDYAANLFNCPTVAYSGELDGQKQAADMMAKALKAEGIFLVHVIGPRAHHFYEPRAKEEVSRRIDRLAERGRNPVPRRVRFTTWTLRYHRMLWVEVDGLEHHWERARVEAELGDDHTVRVKTANVTALTLRMAPGDCPLDNTRRPVVILNGQDVATEPAGSDRSWTARFVRDPMDGKWRAATLTDEEGLHKRHGLQGPIDDAFMDSFLMVRPTGSPFQEKVNKWTRAEMSHALDHWRKQFRGEARVKNDTEVTDADVAGSNLILWGDPGSNKILARIADRLPIRWDREGVHVHGKTYSPGDHVPVLIYPNPLNPKRYVVVNSGFTFREYDYLNNARQVPKLPDYAILDLRVPASSQRAAGIVAAGFFGEHWELAGVRARRKEGPSIRARPETPGGREMALPLPAPWRLEEPSRPSFSKRDADPEI